MVVTIYTTHFTLKAPDLTHTVYLCVWMIFTVNGGYFPKQL